MKDGRAKTTNLKLDASKRKVRRLAQVRAEKPTLGTVLLAHARQCQPDLFRQLFRRRELWRWVRQGLHIVDRARPSQAHGQQAATAITGNRQ